MNEEAPIGSSRFFLWLTEKYTPVTDSLETLSGCVINDRPTPMIERVAVAWSTPINKLSCEQVRLLTSQKMGLEWLADPVAIFVREYPKAFLTFFSGDLSLAALRAFQKLLEIAPHSARQMLKIDYAWMIEGAKETDPSFAREIEDAIANSVLLGRGHS